MRKLLLISAVLAFSAGSALGAGTVGIYFDQGMTVSDTTVQPFETATMYIIMTGANAGVNGIEYNLVLPASVVIMSHNYAGGNGWALQGSPLSYAIAFGSCELIGDNPPFSPNFVVDEISYMALSEFNQSPAMLAACTACGDDPGVTTPRYATCSDLVEDLVASNATIASSTVPVQSESWGAVKALFAN